ncbi:sister chromatid cohesion protein pds5 homolog a [Phtheirospermum japonicum]|uniref:Sister chromatid cohesion protein pds5 homolog a n=1 Tax=Phtheirospermum japonicum TaxID=374723 RepID=A0A830BQJ9_9LAMI|nr:sister chromatid cohesion protein pds5 homolog a [Phtheirospermum japonicum]
MAEAEKKKKEAESEKAIAQIGKELAAYKICPNKRILVKLLQQAESAFPQLKQSESLKLPVKPMSDSLIKHGLFDHKDRDIRVLVGTCLCEIIRVLAPDPGFSLAVSRDISRFLLSMFGELGDIASPFFSKRAKILETVAKLGFCLTMLDTGCEDLVIKMFKSFFGVVREDHPQSLVNSMSSIIKSILEETVDADHDPPDRNPFHSLLDVVLQNIIKERKCVESASYRLAASVIQSCGVKLERSICQFLTSCILKRDAVRSVIKESYHEIILEIYRIAPQLLLSVIPYLIHELMTDQVDVRIKALNLLRKLLALHGQQVARDYPDVFIELLTRFSDKSAEVRLTALSCAEALYKANHSGRESHNILSAIQGRLLDHDDKVRVEAVNVVCELAKTNLNFKSSDLITQAADRLRDKKALVRSKALKKLVELYQDYCTKCAADTTLLNKRIEEIPCKVLMLCYEKDCQEFRPQSMELVLADLFPASLSTEESTRHWIFIFSLFEPPHLKALKTILTQKRRLRDGLKDFLDLWNGAEMPDGEVTGHGPPGGSKDNGSVEAEKKVEALVVKMSSCFPDPAKAKDCFQKLRELKDNEIFNVLREFLTNQITLDTETTKDVYLRELGDQKALSEFIHLLSRKCSFNIFSFEHVHYILDCLSSDEAEKKHLKTIISAFPTLLRGSEKQFQLLLLEREVPFDEQLLEMLAKEGCHMSIKLSDVYSALEKVCLEGTRAQSKLAVSAIAALAGTSEQFIFSKLCKTLVESLCNGQNAPTVLQSLGCLAQHSVSSFEDQEKAFTLKDLDTCDESSIRCSSCKLKNKKDVVELAASQDYSPPQMIVDVHGAIFGLKALVRSFLPHKHACLTRPISFLLDVIQQKLQKCAFPAGSIPCEHGETFICLAAAKSVLRLSRKWDLHISPQIFRSTILMAKDHSPLVRRSFARKIHKLLNNHTVPSRYACAFSFGALDSLADLRSDALKYLEEFIGQYGKRAQLHETTAMQESANHPVYLVVFLIHVLAHDPDFPAPDCRDENIYAEFLSPLFVIVQTLVNEKLFDCNLRHKYNASLHLRSIFNAIKRAEDAVDAQATPKLHLLAAVGISILDSLNINNTPGPHTPRANAYPLIGCKADASFTKKLVSRLKFEVSGIVQTGTKNSQQYENSLRPSSARSRMSNSNSGDKDNLSVNKTKEQIVEMPTGEKEDNPAMSSHIGSVVLTKFSAENKHEKDAHEKPTSSQNEVTESCSRGDDKVNECGSSCARPSKLLRDENQVKCFASKGTQIIETNGETLVGKRIKLWSPIEKCYNSGVVDSFDITKSTHQVTMISSSQIIYKTGEVDTLSLDSETWEIDMDYLQARYCDDSGDASANAQAELLDSKQENLLKKRDNCIRKTSQPVKRSKRNEEALGASLSEAIDMNDNDRPRRSRRQKV